VIVTRSRTLPAAPEAVWKVVADPRSPARRWPRVERMKGITDEGWTAVLRSSRGRAVRAPRRCAGNSREVAAVRDDREARVLRCRGKS
jgi:carbon monoxide dehydrogenase subunit G